ncbi:hypothetical protein FBZ98_101999 [Rhizobium sp. ERR 922]|uniref:hypothetical protein n=1 Tax=unclassified Rhizobium TaxID=2613769 RepID=UPI0011A61922|nr:MULTISPECIES: hypothetical protein [unclassified Rhizobium]TWB61654.1 hypothetical protein FBZ98_101999 [Rhizobium sp. ERR 922]TWC04580.1 hypothetical protein FBZ97_101999 [Rhizobium sp. ERR 942]
MTRCDLRSHNECACRPGECDQMKPMLDLRDTPVIRFTARQQFAGMLMLITFFTVIGWAALYSANESYRVQQLRNQESSIHVARR